MRSRPTRKVRISNTSRGVRGMTRTPARGRRTTRPAPSRMRSPSRTGARETPSRSHSCSSTSRSPGRSSPRNTRSPIRSAASSARLGLSMREADAGARSVLRSAGAAVWSTGVTGGSSGSAVIVIVLPARAPAGVCRPIAVVYCRQSTVTCDTQRWTMTQSSTQQDSAQQSPAQQGGTGTDGPGAASATVAGGERTAGPLAGVTVLEVGVFIAGPYATMQLADMGARVIKIETPGSGDSLRASGPFLEGHSSPFLRLNRNKESIVLDLKSDEGKAALRALLAEADVFVENLRPGSLTKMGFGYDDL